MLRPLPLCLALVATIAAAEPQLRPLPVPPGTKATASCACDDGKGPEMLIDGDLNTWMNPQGGSGLTGRSVTIDLVFPQAIPRVAGLRLGPTDPFQNYYPTEIEVWVDSGSGKFDTMAAAKAGIPPLKQPLDLVFDKPTAAKRIEVRILKHSQGGGGRAPIIAEVGLLRAR